MGLEELSSVVQRHENDLYRGNGKPGLTTRMAVVEDRQDTQEDDMNQFRESLDELKRQGNRNFGMLFVSLLSLVGLLILQLVKVH